jgi:ABC-type multidrug transport system fused ATPase/permease subunit
MGFTDSTAFVFALGLASIAVVVIAAIIKIVAQHLIGRFIYFLRHDISSRLLSRYLEQPYEFFLEHNPSKLAKNVLSEADQVVSGVILPLSQMLSRGAVVLGMALLVFSYDPVTAACIVAVLGVLYSLIYGVVRKRLYLIGLAQFDSNTHRYQSCNEALGGVKDLKITHATNAYLQRFMTASREYSRCLAANNSLNLAPQYLEEAAGFTGLIAIALLLLMRSGDIAQILPALGLYAFTSYRMLPAAQAVYRGFAQLKAGSPALAGVHHDLHLPSEQLPDPALQPMPVHKSIRLDGVSYAYPSAPDKLVLSRFNLEIPANSSLGLVGPSGAGKSTAMDLLLGLLRPQNGIVSVDGIAITQENVAAWQRAIGYVPQHIYLADASIAENIAFGMPLGNIDMEAVVRAARAAQIHDFVIGELPAGYDTLIGDRGIRLSGGQRQRIGIARALYRDPAVLFFDEATSALDGRTEDEFNTAIRDLARAKTIIVIAHKESSLRHCDRIVAINP